MSFVKVEEDYPNDYILVRIVEINHSIGREIGVVLCVSPERDELVTYIAKEGISEDIIILQGINLTPILGGLL
jgi:hypothetical protein